MKTDLVVHLGRTTGATSMFIEGLGLEGCNGMKEIMRKLAEDPGRLESLISQFFAERDFVMWEQALKMRALLRLKAEGHPIEPVPTEIDSRSRDAALRFTDHQPMGMDFILLEQYCAEELGDKDLVKRALKNINSDEGQSLLKLVQGMRTHYGDLEMARNIETHGDSINLLMFGRGHSLKGWGERFQLFRLDIFGYEDGVVGVFGTLPERIQTTLNDFSASDPKCLVLTGWVKAGAERI